MDSQSFNLTKEDFLNSRWQNVIDGCESKDCRDYTRAFWQQAKQAEKIGKVKEQKIFELLAYDIKVTWFGITDRQTFSRLNKE